MTGMYGTAATWSAGGMRRTARVVALALASLVFAAVLTLGATPERAAAENVVPIVFPFEERMTWTDTWGASRSGGSRSHRGNDMPAPKGTPVVAVVDGELDWLNMEEEPSSYNGVPSYNILLRGDDGNVYFYIHLNNDTPDGAGGYTDDGQGGVEYAYAPGLTNGMHVEQGQVIGYVGDSGNAEETVSHLHLELHLGGYGNAINPYPSLMAAPTVAELGQSTRVFRDVAEGEWYYDDLMWLHELGIVQGGDDGAFGPYDDVTRAQFAALLVRALVDGDLAMQAGESAVFSDIPSVHWAAAEIVTAAGLGIVNGKEDGRFDPSSSITRAQMAAMICRAVDVAQLGGPLPVADPDATPDPGSDIPAREREPSADGTGEQEPAEPLPPPPEAPEPAMGPFPDVPADHWAVKEIGRAGEMSLMSGRADGSFDPAGTTKRVHATVVIARALRLLGPVDDLR